MGRICCLWWLVWGSSPPEGWGPSQWQNLSSDALQLAGITTQLKHKTQLSGRWICFIHLWLSCFIGGFVISDYTGFFIFLFFCGKLWLSFVGGTKKNERTRIYNTHLDCKLCILLYLNLPKTCKAPHVCSLDSQLSVRITSLSLSLSQMREKRIILMRIWRQECWTWESSKLIFCLLFSIQLSNQNY